MRLSSETGKQRKWLANPPTRVKRRCFSGAECQPKPGSWVDGKLRKKGGTGMVDVNFPTNWTDGGRAKVVVKRRWRLLRSNATVLLGPSRCLAKGTKPLQAREHQCTTPASASMPPASRPPKAHGKKGSIYPFLPLVQRPTGKERPQIWALICSTPVSWVFDHL